MMRFFKYITGYLLFLSLLFQSCSDDRNTLSHQGFLELGVSKNVEVITRGFDVEDQSLSVDICSGKDGSVVKHFSDYNDMAGERVLLEVGSYTIKVKSNPVSKLDFEKPTFYGEKANVSVTAGNTTSTSVECKLSCVKVTTEFTKPVQEKFEFITARISDSSSSYLDYSMEETRAGYFQPGFLLVDLTLTNKEGLEFKMSKLIENTEERDYYHLIFDLIDSGDNNSGMDFDISIETNPTNDEEHTVTVPLPGTGYEQYPPVVKVMENGVVGDGIITLDKGDKTSLLFETSSTNIGLKSVYMLTSSIDFEKNKIPLSLDLMNLSEEDKVKLQGINLSPAISEDKTSLSLDYSTLISILSGGTHTFIFSVLDLMGHETIQKITININLSIMTVNVHDADVWAHCATLCGYIKNANVSDINSYKFQYKLKEDKEWTDVSGNVNILDNIGSNGANITQVVTNLDDSSEYEYRIVFGETAAEPLSFITEEAKELYNGNLDNWYKNDKTWYPNESGVSFWDSSNPGTTTGAGALVNINPTQSNNTIVHTPGGKSAELKSQYASAFGIGKFAAASLYSGRFNDLVGSSGAKIDFGQPFTSRPSALHGYFQYTPAKIDNLGDNQPSNTVKKGDIDICSIYIALSKKTYTVDNTNTSTFIDFNNDENIIAYGELPLSECVNTNGQWKKFTIHLEYKTMEKPDDMYIIIVASSSKYGDYFTGSTGSIMYLDDLELVYPNSIEEIKRK